MVGRCIILAAGLIGLMIALGELGFAAGNGAPDVAPPAPPVPKISSIRLMPESLTLQNARDARRVLVIGQTESGKRVDLTNSAIFKTDSTAIEVGNDGYIRARRVDRAEVT